MPRKKKTHRTGNADGAKPGEKKEARPRASWSGNLRFGLVNIPVQAFNARTPEGGEIVFHKLHSKCHSRIRYEKHCPLHGAISNDEIVSGYEYAKDRYVELELRGTDADGVVPGMRAHLEGCAACAEDRDSLRAFLRSRVGSESLG